MTSGDTKAVKINLRDIKICLKELNIHEISIRLYSWNYNFTFTIRGKNTVIFKEMNLEKDTDESKILIKSWPLTKHWRDMAYSAFSSIIDILFNMF